MDKLKIVPKGWGYEVHIANSELYCGKQLHFIKGRHCSVHYHKLKDETFFLASGELEVKYFRMDKFYESKGEEWKGWRDKEPEAFKEDWICWNQTIILKPGDAFHVMPYMAHTMKGLVQSDMFEFSTQDFPEDSYRIIKGD